MNKKFLICIVGPTAIGKTALSIKLARHFKSEIISGDSRQFYKEMRIGTAVPEEAELALVPHHFIQHKSIEEPYSVGDFERDAISKLKELFSKHDVVIMVGGSGLYIDAVINGLDYFPEVDKSIREELNKEFTEKGIFSLQKKLKQLDPEYYKEVDKENPHRLIRALEICMGTGKSYSAFKKGKKADRFFTPIFIGLTAEREIIYERINKRVDLMLEAGFMAEAQGLLPKKKLNALNTVGYKELFQYLDRKMAFDDAISEIKKNTRRFAKRQLTWFRKNEKIEWFDISVPVEKIIAFAEKRMEDQ